MADDDANEGSKRRLPSWMSGVNACDRSSKSESNSPKIVSVGENLDNDRLETSPPKGGRKRKPRNGGDAVNNKKKKKRNGVDDEIESESEKHVRRKKGKKSKSCELGNGDEEELTVDDLMSIAGEEYIGGRVLVEGVIRPCRRGSGGTGREQEAEAEGVAGEAGDTGKEQEGSSRERETGEGEG
ncbi:hypothetical protein Syun_012549 [Stephania yunnanensis]|uniref:Uncharacterized protein n=1 Tax=Stephania yunnanensis TaxID=152371 RepID=A0AAP0K0E1_9MAGN